MEKKGYITRSSMNLNSCGFLQKTEERETLGSLSSFPASVEPLV